MEFEVVRTDFIDIVSACMLKSKSESESFCLMVLFSSTNLCTHDANSISKKSVSIPNSIIFILSLREAPSVFLLI